MRRERERERERDRQTDRQTDRHYKVSAVLLLTLTHVSFDLTKHWSCL